MHRVDGRLFLTKVGCEVQEALTPVVVAHCANAFKGLTEHDLATARGILEHIVGNLDKSLKERIIHGS